MQGYAEIESKPTIFRSALSFEALVAYYVFSGLLKSVLHYYEINTPIDITVLFMGIIFLFVLNEWLSKKGLLKVNSDSALLILLFTIFYSWMAFTLIYTASENYAYEKVFKSLTNLIFIVLILRGKFNTSRFFNISFVLLVLILLWFLPIRFLYISGQSPKGYWFTREIMGLYLHISMPLGMILLYYLTSKYNISNNRIINFLLYGCALIGMLLLGARGPILIFLIVYLFYFLLNGKIRMVVSRKKLIYALSALLIFTILIYVFRAEVTDLFNLSIGRFKLIFSGLGSPENDFGSSINERIEQIAHATRIIFDSIKNFLFGTGIGSFGILSIGEDIRSYPHNFILEIWCELGLVGLLIFLSLVILSIQKIRIYDTNLSIFPILYILLNFMKSGNLSDMRLLFTVLAIYYISTLTPGRQ